MTLLERLARQGLSLLAVHRLDLETSGVVLLARDPEARAALMQLFKEHGVKKSYLAIIQGILEPRAGVLDFPIQDLGAKACVHQKGRPAITCYRTLEVFRGGQASLVEMQPETGRHNQIRLHCAHVGHPLVGERKYARGRDAAVGHKRAALHAASLELALPWSGQRLKIQAPLPRDLENLLARLGASV